VDVHWRKGSLEGPAKPDNGAEQQYAGGSRATTPLLRRSLCSIPEADKSDFAEIPLNESGL
jgi:hypothetical protein